MNILDVGCGLNPKKDANILLDIDVDSYKDYFSGVRLVSHDLNKSSYLPFTKDSIDKLYCTSVLEHISNCTQCILNDFYRVLKIDGVLIITVPNSYFITHRLRYLFGWLQHDLMKTHVNHFHPQELFGMLTRAGFKIEIKHNKKMLLPAIINNNISIVCRKVE